MNDERYYAVRMLWVRDQQAWDKYQEMAKPVLARHEVQMEQWLVTDTINGEGIDKPDRNRTLGPTVTVGRKAF